MHYSDHQPNGWPNEVEYDKNARDELLGLGVERVTASSDDRAITAHGSSTRMLQEDLSLAVRNTEETNIYPCSGY